MAAMAKGLLAILQKGWDQRMKAAQSRNGSDCPSIHRPLTHLRSVTGEKWACTKLGDA